MSAITQKQNKGNLIKIHRKIKQNEKVRHAQEFPMTKVNVTIEDQRLVIYKSCVSHISKTNEENLIKSHRKIKQNEKVCRAQN